MAAVSARDAPQPATAATASVLSNQEMPGEAQSLEEVGQLVLKLSQAGKDGDVMKLFAAHISALVPGFTGVSILLLPTTKASLANTKGIRDKQHGKLPQLARLDWQQHAGSKKLSKAEAAKKAQLIDPELSSWQYADCQTNPCLSVLSWKTCKQISLTAAEGAKQRHPPPPYPASCTAACCIARSTKDVITTGDYLQDGPHFADWAELQQEGAVSMASVPISMNSEVVAALTIGCTQPGAFNEEMIRRLWVLSFVLAPYTHLLSQTAHVPPSKQLVNRIMPPLLEHHVTAYAHHDHSSSRQTTDSNRAPDSGHMCPQCQEAASQGSPKMHGKKAKGHKRAKKHAGLTELQADSSAASLQQSQEGVSDDVTASGNNANPSRTYQTAAHRSMHNADLDWGDFFFNLISMCIVYAHFSNVAIAGEGHRAVLFSMVIAGVDIMLLLLRWLWRESFVPYRGFVKVIFNLYRVVVLPVANTWMSWSLLSRLQWTASASVHACLALLSISLLTLGLKVRFFLHAPLQLTTVLMAAASAPGICGLMQASTSGMACLSLISGLQMTWGLLIPSLIAFMLDFRVGSGFIPHIQEKPWLTPHSLPSDKQLT